MSGTDVRVGRSDTVNSVHPTINDIRGNDLAPQNVGSNEDNENFNADTETLLKRSSPTEMDGWRDVNQQSYGTIQHVMSTQSISAEYERAEDAEGISCDDGVILCFANMYLSSYTESINF